MTNYAYYLVHSLGGKSIFKNTDFAEIDKRAAKNFIAAADAEGLKNEVVCFDNSIEQFVPIVKTPFKEAVKIAVSEEKEGPGITGF